MKLPRSRLWLAVAVFLASGAALAQKENPPEILGLEANLQGVKVCISSSLLSALWVEVNEPPPGFTNEALKVGQDLVDLVSLRLQRNNIPFEVAPICGPESHYLLSWVVTVTRPIGGGYRGGSLFVYVYTNAYSLQGKLYPYFVRIYGTGTTFALGPFYSSNATQLLLQLRDYVLERLDNFIADWKKANK